MQSETSQKLDITKSVSWMLVVPTTFPSAPMIASQRSLSTPFCFVQWTILRRRKPSYRCDWSVASVAPLPPERYQPSRCSAPGRRLFSGLPPTGGVEPSVPPVPSSAASSDTTTAPPSSIANNESSSFHENFKKSGAQVHIQKPRPIFPWRHEFFPIPRLMVGTKEYEEAGRSFLAGWVAQRTTASWFLNVPFTTILFGFSSWKQTMADQAAYAFTQGVAGILSNVSQLPLESVALEADDEMPVVHFAWNYDEEAEEDEEVNDNQQPHDAPFAESKEAPIAEPKDEAAIFSSAFPVDSPVDSTNSNATKSDTEASVESELNFSDESLSKSSMNVPIDDNLNASNAVTLESLNSFSTVEETHRSNAREPDSSKEPVTRHPAFQRPFIHKTYVDPSATKEESTSQSNAEVKEETLKETPVDEEDTKFGLDIREMMIEPLRKLYESAHESGRDQLIIRLQMKPVDATLFNLMCIPYVTREASEKNPERLHSIRKVKFGSAAVHTVLDNLEHDLDEKGKLETTVEMQVWIRCLESFQVMDRETGAVLQGSADGMLQEVSHIVRFEATSVQEIIDGKAYVFCSNWKITDIDDMLGHVAWYQK